MLDRSNRSNVIQDEMISQYRKHTVVVRLVNLHPKFMRSHFEAYYSLDNKCGSIRDAKDMDRLPEVHGGYTFGPGVPYSLDENDSRKMYVGWRYDHKGDELVARTIFDVLIEAKKAVDAYEAKFGDPEPEQTK